MTKAKGIEPTIRVHAVINSSPVDKQAQIKALQATYNRTIKTTVLSKIQINAFNKGWRIMQAAKQ